MCINKSTPLFDDFCLSFKACNKRKQFYIANTNYYLWHCFDGNLKMICYILTVLSRMNKVVERWYLNNWFICLIFCRRQINKMISRQFFNQTYGTLWYNHKYHKYKCNSNMSSICLVFMYKKCIIQRYDSLFYATMTKNWLIVR